jgi:hypothetical protein
MATFLEAMRVRSADTRAAERGFTCELSVVEDAAAAVATRLRETAANLPFTLITLHHELEHRVKAGHLQFACQFLHVGGCESSFLCFSPQHVEYATRGFSLSYSGTAIRTVEKYGASAFALIHYYANALERHVMPTPYRLLAETRSVLAHLGEHATARALLQIALPAIEIAFGGPTNETTLLRGGLGELCEVLCDHRGAIRAYLGVTQECAHLLLNAASDSDRLSGCSFGTAWNNLGLAYTRAGLLVPAVNAYQQALEGADSDLSADVQLVRVNLLNVLFKDLRVAPHVDRQELVMTLFGGQAHVLATLSQHPGFTGCVEVRRQGKWFVRGCYLGKPALAPAFVLHDDFSTTLESISLDATWETPSQSELLEQQVPIMWKKEGSLDLSTCSGCASLLPRTELKQCPCKLAWYCSVRCQRSHRATHKLVCTARGEKKRTPQSIPLIDAGHSRTDPGPLPAEILSTEMVEHLGQTLNVDTALIDVNAAWSANFARVDIEFDQQQAIRLECPVCVTALTGGLDVVSIDAGWNDASKVVHLDGIRGSEGRPRTAVLFPSIMWLLRVADGCNEACVRVIPLLGDPRRSSYKATKD